MTTFALEGLFDAVKSHFDALFATPPTTEVPSPPPQKVVTVEWGRLEGAKQTNIGTRGRIVLVPNAADGSIGQVGAPEQPGRTPKPLYSQDRKFHFLVLGRDPTKQDRQRPQDHTAELILHELLRAIYIQTHFWGPNQLTSPVDLGEAVVVKPEAQIPYGVEYRVPGTVQSAVVDQYDDFAEWIDATPLKSETTITTGNASSTFQTGA